MKVPYLDSWMVFDLGSAKVIQLWHIIFVIVICVYLYTHIKTTLTKKTRLKNCVSRNMKLTWVLWRSNTWIHRGCHTWVLRRCYAWIHWRGYTWVLRRCHRYFFFCGVLFFLWLYFYCFISLWNQTYFFFTFWHTNTHTHKKTNKETQIKRTKIRHFNMDYGKVQY